MAPRCSLFFALAAGYCRIAKAAQHSAHSENQTARYMERPASGDRRNFALASGPHSALSPANMTSATGSSTSLWSEPSIGSQGKRFRLPKNYPILSSTNLVYRDQLPPEYRLPSLIRVPQPDLRGINTVDNEQQIPDIDFREALRKFEVNPNESDGIAIDTGNTLIPGLRKTYSENETSNYDWKSGRRKSVTIEPSVRNTLYPHDTLPNLISGWDPDYHHETSKREILKSQDGNDGIFDEYIPNFVKFNLSKFDIDEHAIVDDEAEKNDTLSPIFGRKRKKVAGLSEQDRSSSSVDPLSEGFERTKPITIEKNKEESATNAPDLSESFPVSDECFKIAASPERELDRVVLTSIPKNFYSLSFSHRKKMLTHILPESLRNNTDYKNHISKILRRNSASFSNPNSSSCLEMFAPRRTLNLKPDPNTNKLGSVLFDKWKLGRVFNNGSFGIIRECFDINDADNIKAVKVIPIHKSLTKLNEFRNEIMMWSTMDNPLIVPLLNVKITEENIFLLMPLYEEGSLFDKVKHWESNKVSLQDRLVHIFFYLKSIVQALKYLHDNEIHHGDIKLENFVLEKNVPKLCDFGNTNFDLTSKQQPEIESELTKISQRELDSATLKLSNRTSSSKLSKLAESNSSACLSWNRIDLSGLDITIHPKSDNALNKLHQPKNEINIGSLPYAAPELLKPCPIPTDRKADIWAFGVMTYTFIMMKLPFWHIYEPRLKLKILDGNWETEEWVNIIASDPKLKGLNTIIKGCLSERETRFEIDQIIALLHELDG